MTLHGAIDPHAQQHLLLLPVRPDRRPTAPRPPLADAGAGDGRARPIGVPVSGLQPLTVYHYRLIAVNAPGAATGAGRAFKTAKVPLSLAILVSPNPTVFGSTATVQGTLSGTGNAGRAVVLQQNPFPYTAGFADVGNPELTTSTGSFSFPVVGLAQATQFRVVTTTTPPVISPVAIEGVAVHVSAHVGRAAPAPLRAHLRHRDAGRRRHGSRHHARQRRPQRARRRHDPAPRERDQLALQPHDPRPSATRSTACS